MYEMTMMGDSEGGDNDRDGEGAVYEVIVREVIVAGDGKGTLCEVIIIGDSEGVIVPSPAPVTGDSDGGV